MFTTTYDKILAKIQSDIIKNQWFRHLFYIFLGPVISLDTFMFKTSCMVGLLSLQYDENNDTIYYDPQEINQKTLM